MSPAIEQRLQRLERTQDATLGLRVFLQTPEGTSDVFVESGDSVAWTAAKVHALSVAGWTVLKVVYGAN
jgi:hypothetical protein